MFAFLTSCLFDRFNMNYPAAAASDWRSQNFRDAAQMQSASYHGPTSAHVRWANGSPQVYKPSYSDGRSNVSPNDPYARPSSYSSGRSRASDGNHYSNYNSGYGQSSSYNSSYSKQSNGNQGYGSYNYSSSQQWSQSGSKGNYDNFESLTNKKWKMDQLVPFEKNFYKDSAIMCERSDRDVEKYR